MVRVTTRPDGPWHFSAFHPDFKMVDKPPTPPETHTRARRIALSNGMHYAYTGNVHDPEVGSAWRPGCGQRLVEPDWYVLGEGNHAGSRCASCGCEIAGRFEEKPGTWGARRPPVVIGEE